MIKTMQVHQPGGPEALQPASVATPKPRSDEALVRLHAAGVNFIDIYHRKGLYPLSLPFTPGSEGAGVVEAIGPDVTDVQVGDRVAFAMHPGAYAEAVTIPAWKLAPLPDDVSFAQGAAVMLQGMTAHYLASSTFPLKSGDRALVHAAAGGVGGLLVQIAKLRGATVIGTVSTEEKAAVAKEGGADHVILYSETDFAAETRRLTDDRGVDVVYDSVGQDTFEKSLTCLRPRGYLVLFGQSSGPVPPVDLQILNQHGSLFTTRPSLGHYLQDREELQSRAADLFQWMAERKVRLRIDQTFPLRDAADAHRRLESRQSIGKIVLDI